MVNPSESQGQETPAHFPPLPAGKYTAVITRSETKTTRAGNGVYFEFSFRIVKGEFVGRRLWVRLNLIHPNPTVVRAAQAELAAICRAVGVPEPKDSRELHNLPLVIHVGQRKAETGESVNEIHRYEPQTTVTQIPNRDGLISEKTSTVGA